MKEIKKKFIKAFEAGDLLDLSDPEQVKAFFHCMDKYSEIIAEFKGSLRLLEELVQ